MNAISEAHSAPLLPSYSCVLSHLRRGWSPRRCGDSSQARSSAGSVLPLGRSWGSASFSVSVLYLSCQMSQCAHSASALTNSPLGLERPIVASDLAGGVASRSASLLLLVPVLSARVATERIRLVAAFSLSLSSLRHCH